MEPVHARGELPNPEIVIVDGEPTWKDYGYVVSSLAAWCGGLYWLTARHGGMQASAGGLLGPMLGMTLLVAVVWMVMVLVRNYAVLSKLAHGSYYRTYAGTPPPEWVERPARTFNNLMQLPWLFLFACLVMLQMGSFDAAQVALAWAFVFARWVHAVVYIALNHVPARFGSWVAGALTLWVLWYRLAAATWHLL